MIIDYNDLPKIREKNPGLIIGLFKGTFDLFHFSHLNCLNEIKSNVNILVVEVKSDIDVKNKKGNSRPIIPELQRACIVDNIKSVDYTIIANKIGQTSLISDLINTSDYTEGEIYKLKRDGLLIESLKPDYIFSTDEKPVPTAIKDLCENLDVKIHVFPMYKGMHTTDIIGKCKKA